MIGISIVRGYYGDSPLCGGHKTIITVNGHAAPKF
jgi:hypothetical protein